MKRNILYIALVSALLAGCLKDPSWTTDSPEDPSSQGGEHPTGVVEMKLIKTGIENMSGLCMSQDGNSIWGISDSKGLYRFDLDGNQIEHVFSTKQDFEAVAVDHATGEVYLVEETNGSGNSKSVWKLDKSTNNPVKFCTINEAGDVSNKGLEGLTVIDGVLWVANQMEPTDIYLYDIAAAKVKSTVHITGATYLSDLCYDSVADVIWVTDSKRYEIFTMDRTGKRLSTYSIPSSYDKSEGIAVDRKNGYIYLCSDSTGDIAKIKFNF